MAEVDLNTIAKQLTDIQKENALLNKKFDEILSKLTKYNFSEPIPEPPKLKRAVENGRKDYLMTYKDSKGKLSQREINVRNVTIKDGKLNLNAFCFTRNRIKTFSVKNIVSIQDLTTDKTYSTTEDVYAELGTWMDATE